MIRRLQSARRLVRNRSGATVTEFAIIVPVLLSLIIFLVEGSIQLTTDAVLQFGLREAARFGATGEAYPLSMAAKPPASREAAIAQIITAVGAGLINQSNLTVTLTNYPAFSAIGGVRGGTNGAGGPGAIVQYQVSYFRPWLFSGSAYPPALVTGLSGLTYNLTMVVQNEPFPAN